MKEVLKNLANLDLIGFCKRHGIDCSGSYCVKIGRGFTYALRDQETGVDFVFVIFHKTSAPAHMINKEYWRTK